MSDIPIPEWSSFAVPPANQPADTTIRLRTDACPPLPDGESISVEPGQFRIEVPDAGIFVARATGPGPGSIEIACPCDPDFARIRALLTGLVWGALCHLRAMPILHASVVLRGDRAIAFCGESGQGKSSMAAWMVSHGWCLLCDDICALSLAGDPPASQPVLAYPAAARLKLWSDALLSLGWTDRGVERDCRRMDKYHVRASAPDGRMSSCPSTLDPAPLSCIVLLDWGDLEVRTLRGIESLRQLVTAATYHGELLEPMGRLAATWELMAEVARRVPIRRLTRPRDWSRMPDVAASLEVSIQ